MLQPLLDGDADVVYGSRFLGGHAHRVLNYWHSVGNPLPHDDVERVHEAAPHRHGDLLLPIVDATMGGGRPASWSRILLTTGVTLLVLDSRSRRRPLTSRMLPAARSPRPRLHRLRPASPSIDAGRARTVEPNHPSPK